MGIVYTAVNDPNYPQRAVIHAAGCRDIVNDRNRGLRDRYDWPEVTGDQWLDHEFGDLAADAGHVPGTAEYAQYLREEAADVKIAPCAKSLGFAFP